MSNNKQSSSIDFFWNQLPEILPFSVDTETAVKLWEAFEQAKAIHKEEMIDFAMKFMMQDRPIISFYNETYVGNNERNLSK